MRKNLWKAVCLSALILGGCAPAKKIDTKNLEISDLEKGPEMVDYFAKTPGTYSENTSPSVIGGDFDGDGDLDYIITQRETDRSRIVNGYYITDTKSYFMENDGKGNFKLRQYENKK